MSAAGSKDESMDDPGFANEVTICLNCGDEGTSNAFIYCVYCLKYAVHRYCLRTMPALDEFVHWACDDCNEVTSSKDVKTVTNDLRTINSKHVGNNHKKKQVQWKTGDMVSKLKDNAQKKGSKKDKVLLHEGMENLFIGPSGKPKNKERENRVSPSFDPTAKLKYQHQRSVKGDANLKKVDRAAHKVVQSYNKLKNGNSDSVMTDDSSQSVLNQQSHSSPLSNPSLDDPLIDSNDVAEPVIDQIWSGSFNILDTMEFDEEVDRLIVAHLSKKVGKQVYDEVKSFPSMLELELHPKAHVWPKSFHKAKPSDGDIAVYFFPMSKSCEGVFDDLVEKLMVKELALKAVTKNAELLIFTSNELPLNFWRFHQKYYLWGVFRRKQT